MCVCVCVCVCLLCLCFSQPSAGAAPLNFSDQALVASAVGAGQIISVLASHRFVHPHMLLRFVFLLEREILGARAGSIHV